MNFDALPPDAANFDHLRPPTPFEFLFPLEDGLPEVYVNSGFRSRLPHMASFFSASAALCATQPYFRVADIKRYTARTRVSGSALLWGHAAYDEQFRRWKTGQYSLPLAIGEQGRAPNGRQKQVHRRDSPIVRPPGVGVCEDIRNITRNAPLREVKGAAFGMTHAFQATATACELSRDYLMVSRFSLQQRGWCVAFEAPHAEGTSHGGYQLLTGTESQDRFRKICQRHSFFQVVYKIERPARATNWRLVEDFVFGCELNWKNEAVAPLDNADF